MGIEWGHSEVDHEKDTEDHATRGHSILGYDRGRVVSSWPQAGAALGPGTAATRAGTGAGAAAVAGHACREAVAQHCAVAAQSGRLGPGAPGERGGSDFRPFA